MASRSPSRSPSRGRSRTRSHTPNSVHRALSPTRRSPSPRSRSRSRTRSLSRSVTRSPPARDIHNGGGGRRQIFSPSRSRSPSAGDRRSYRERSYIRRHSHSPGRDAQRAQSSKIVIEKLTKNVTEAHLREIFGAYGHIESIDLPLNKQCMCDQHSYTAILTPS